MKGVYKGKVVLLLLLSKWSVYNSYYHQHPSTLFKVQISIPYKDSTLPQKHLLPIYRVTSSSQEMTTTSTTKTAMSGASTTPPPQSSWPYFSSRSFALHAIPVSYALAYPPHIYVLGKLMSTSTSSTAHAFTNMVPRVNLERLGPSLPKATTDMLWRARGCHLNALEGFPLFAAAMVSPWTQNRYIWIIKYPQVFP